jgi:potassium-dependent mechanosensitive channel
MVLSCISFGQDTAMLSAEVFRKESREIDLAKISLESTDIMFTLAEEEREIVSDEDLQNIQSEVESIISETDSLLRFRVDDNLEVRNLRSIRNHLNFWKQKLLELEFVDGRILSLSKELDKNRLKHARELASWNDIRKIALEYNYEPAVISQVDEVITELETAINTYGRKSNVTLNLLNDLNVLTIQVNDRIEFYDEMLISKQRNILHSGYPGFFSLDFGKSENWMLADSFVKMHQGEFKALVFYFRNHLSTVIWHLILLVASIFFFLYLKRIGIPEGRNEDATYRRSIRIIVANPVNSALILGLFASAFLYQNKPMLFNDIFKLVITVPLAITLGNLVNKKYWSIIVAFVALVILQIISTNLSVHLIPSRILLFFIAFIEIGTLAAFIGKLKHTETKHPTLRRVVLLLAYVHMAVAVIGILTNLSGKVLLTQVLLNAVSGTVLALVLIVMAMLVGNGLMMIFIDSSMADHINVIRKRKEYLKDGITRMFQVMAVIFMAYYIIEAYGLDVYIGDSFRFFFKRERSLGSVSYTWGQVLLFFLVIWLSLFISKLIRIFLEEEILDRMGLQKGLPNTIALMVRYTLVTLGFLAAASAAGMKLSNLTIILGALGVGIGFGLQNIFNNLVSGLILLLERPIKIGDTIEVGSLIGTVQHIGIRASNVHTVDGAEIIVPNGNLISNEVINWTLSDKRRRIEVLIGVAYGSDPHRVREIFYRILDAHPEVVKNPKPIVLLNNFGDSSLDFRILFWTDNFDDWIRIRSDVNLSIHDELKQNGITIPFPQWDIHIKSGEAEKLKS